MKLMCCIKGGICGGPQGSGGGPGSNPVWDQLETGSGGARWACALWPSPVFIYLFLDPFIYSFIYSSPSTRLPLAALNNLAASPSLK